MRCNVCISCRHTECKYWNESDIAIEGECTKPVIYLFDIDCKALKEVSDEDSN